MIHRMLLATLALAAVSLSTGCAGYCKGPGCGTGLFHHGHGGGCGVAAGPCHGCGDAPCADIGPRGHCDSCCYHRGFLNSLCWSPGALLKEFFTCDGCMGPMYWNEWYNDPPNCCDTCDNHGNWTGPPPSTQYRGGGGGRPVPTPAGEMYYEEYREDAPPALPTPARRTGPTPTPAKAHAGTKATVIPASHHTPLNTKCNCAQ